MVFLLLNPEYQLGLYNPISVFPHVHLNAQPSRINPGSVTFMTPYAGDVTRSKGAYHSIDVGMA